MLDEKPSSDVRVPRQQRSIERVESILESAKLLIGEKGSAALKVQEIAERAGVTAGSMYQYFPNKGAILRALAQQYLDQFHDLLKATLTTPPQTVQECQESLSSLLDQFYTVNCQDPVLRDVWLSISADKAMREMDARSSQQNAAILFDTFKHLFPELLWPGLKRYFLLVVYITPPAIRLALSADPKESLEYIETAKRMINTSLADWATE